MPQREVTVGRRFAELNGQDAYKLLGVTADASPDTIKQAHRAQIRVWHSDQHHGSADFADAEAKTRLLNVARDILATRRAEYDAYLRPGGAEVEVDREPRPPRFVAPRPGPKPRPVLTAVLGVLLLLALFVASWFGGRQQHTAVRPVAVPGDLAGTWTGLLNHPGTGGTELIRIELHAGAQAGAETLPLSGCAGSLTPARINGGELVLTERITQGGCVAGAPHVRATSGGGLALTGYGPGAAGTALLTREPASGPPRLPAAFFGKWTGRNGIVLTLVDGTPGLAGTVTWGRRTCLVAPLSAATRRAVLLAMGAGCGGTYDLVITGQPTMVVHHRGSGRATLHRVPPSPWTG
jgi:hypothetical protein